MEKDTFYLNFENAKWVNPNGHKIRFINEIIEDSVIVKFRHQFQVWRWWNSPLPQLQTPQVPCRVSGTTAVQPPLDLPCLSAGTLLVISLHCHPHQELQLPTLLTFYPLLFLLIMEYICGLFFSLFCPYTTFA